MFTKTHQSTASNGDVYQVYRDKDAGLMVTKFTAHRGGCLYLGEVTIVNTRTAQSFAFTSTAPVWSEDTGHLTATSYMRKHAIRVGAEYS